MTRIVNFICGRRTRWLMIGVWILIMAAMGPLGGRFESAQKNDSASFLPASSEALKVIEADEGFADGELVPAVIVVRNEAGLGPADQTRIADFVQAIEAERFESALPALDPVPSQDGKAALVNVPLKATGDSELLVNTVDRMRELARPLATGGTQVKVSGPAGFSADAIKVFEGINGKLLISTGALVLILLLLIYRSPIFWFLPFLAVIAAEVVTTGLGYLVTQAGVTVNGQSGGILRVLVFGVATDYALLLTARYREELRQHESSSDAMRIALGRVAPSIIASAGTVIAGLLCLLLADVNGTRGLGPIGALGVAVAMISMLTFLPPLLVLGGRRAFWPFVPRFGSVVREEQGVWAGVGRFVARRYRLVAIGVTVILVVLGLGVTRLDDNLTQGNSFRETVESVQGQDLLATSFPAGANAPTVVFSPDPAALERAKTALMAAPGVAATGSTEQGASGSRFPVTLTEAPFTKAAFALIDPLRTVAKDAGGDGVLIGGPTAQEHDLRVASTRDNKVLIPVLLAVIFVILIALLRSLAAPVVLIATVMLSLVAALGLSLLVIDAVFDFPGEDPSLPLFAAIFLVALGVDYNIFLMARVREEAGKMSTRAATVRGLAVTGSVITSAGIVLAGTFLVLGVLPIVALTQIGVVVALGVLLDTLIVRSLLVPAIVYWLGEKTWWPSRAPSAE